MKTGTMREQRIDLFLLFWSAKWTKGQKRSKDKGSDDCMKHPLTQSESMLVALSSLHSMGTARVRRPQTHSASEQVGCVPNGIKTQYHAQ